MNISLLRRHPTSRLVVLRFRVEVKTHLRVSPSFPFPRLLSLSDMRRTSEHGFPRSKTIAFDPNQINQPHLHGGKSQAAAKHLPRTGTIEDSTGGIGGRRITTGAGFERSMYLLSLAAPRMLS